MYIYIYIVFQEFLLGSLQTSVGGLEKKLGFSADDVLTKATMRVGDKVQFKLSTNPKTKTERAVCVEILPNTFEGTKEQRKSVSLSTLLSLEQRVCNGRLVSLPKCHKSISLVQ